MQRLFKSLIGLVYVFAIVAAVASTGCKQDPLDGFDKSVTEATPPNSKTDPDESNAVIIDVSSEVVDVKEGEELQFKVSGRVLLPESTFTIEIRNLASFPGMVYDPATSMVAWQVPEGYLNGTDHQTLPLNIMMTTNEAPFLYDQKVVQVTVFKKIVRPEVVKIHDIDPMTEGDTKYFNVIVKSIDEPELAFVQTNSYYNGAGYLSVYDTEQDPYDPTRWIVQVRVRLPDEVTKAEIDLSFGVRVISPKGTISQLEESTYRVFTQLAYPENSWNAPIEFTVGVLSSYSFVIYDPKQEAETLQFDIDKFCAPLTGAVCSCTTESSYQRTCKIEWAPTDEGLYYVEEMITAKLDTYNQSLSQETYLSRNVAVVKGATP